LHVPQLLNHKAIWVRGIYCHSLSPPGHDLVTIAALHSLEPTCTACGGLAYRNADAWHHQEPHAGSMMSPGKLGHPHLRAAGSASHLTHKNLLLTKHLQLYLSSQLQQRGRNSQSQVKSSPPAHLPRVPPLTGARAPQQPLVQCSKEEGCSPRCHQEGRDPAAPA